MNLVYACVFYNRDYMKLLELLLASMKIYSSTDTFDFLVLTSPGFEESLEELSSKTGIQIKTMCIPLTTIFEAACARLRIFDYEFISRYDTILYLDTDILIKGDLAPLFSLAKDKILYAIEEGTIASKNFGGLLFRPGAFDMKTAGINSGTLLFQNCLPVRDLFSRIRGHIQGFTDKGEASPYALDQPFINYHAIQSGIYDNKALNPFVSLYEKSDTVTNYETSVICHFSFPIGNFGHKYNRMKAFFINLLREPCIEGCEYENRVKGRQLTWGSGFIEFGQGRELHTSWGKGEYEIKSPDLVCAFWNNYFHMLKFNEKFSECISVRIYPKDCQVSYSKLLK